MMFFNYFRNLWQTSKGLFVGVMLFVVAQAFFMYKGILNFPFFPFQMYAFPFQEPTKVEQVEIYANNKLVDYTALPDWYESTIVRTIQFYDRYQKGNNWAMKTWNSRFGTPQSDIENLIYNRLVPSEKQIASYPLWIASYIGRATRQDVKTLQIIRKQYQYSHHELVATSQEHIILDY